MKPGWNMAVSVIEESKWQTLASSLWVWSPSLCSGIIIHWGCKRGEQVHLSYLSICIRHKQNFLRWNLLYQIWNSNQTKEFLLKDSSLNVLKYTNYSWLFPSSLQRCVKSLCLCYLKSFWAFGDSGMKVLSRADMEVLRLTGARSQLHIRKVCHRVVVTPSWGRVVWTLKDDKYVESVPDVGA